MRWIDVVHESDETLFQVRAARHSLPAIFTSREFALAGGLIAYGSSLAYAFLERKAQKQLQKGVGLLRVARLRGA
jgi:hypothetical protein